MDLIQIQTPAQRAQVLANPQALEVDREIATRPWASKNADPLTMSIGERIPPDEVGAVALLTIPMIPSSELEFLGYPMDPSAQRAGLMVVDAPRPKRVVVVGKPHGVDLIVLAATGLPVTHIPEEPKLTLPKLADLKMIAKRASRRKSSLVDPAKTGREVPMRGCKRTTKPVKKTIRRVSKTKTAPRRKV